MSVLGVAASCPGGRAGAAAHQSAAGAPEAPLQTSATDHQIQRSAHHHIPMPLHRSLRHGAQEPSPARQGVSGGSLPGSVDRGEGSGAATGRRARPRGETGTIRESVPASPVRFAEAATTPRQHLPDGASNNAGSIRTKAAGDEQLTALQQDTYEGCHFAFHNSPHRRWPATHTSVQSEVRLPSPTPTALVVPFCVHMPSSWA